MTILQRTLKFVFAMIVAMAVAEFFNLMYASSAGIIAILSLLDTRKSTLSIARQRLLSAALALTIAITAFFLFGYSLWVIGLYMMIYVPLAYYWHLEVGIAPITVLVLHIYSEQGIDLPIVANEIALLAIGLITALLVNLYMPSKLPEIGRLRMEVDERLREVLIRFSYLLKTGDGTNDGQLIGLLDQKLSQAIHLVYQESNNQLFHSTNYYVHYFEMRQRQSRILKEMAQAIQQLQVKSEESLLLSQLFERIALQLSHHNPGTEIIEDIQEALIQFRQRPLPQTRQEFESRALLFQLLGDLERFILEKIDFYGAFQEKNPQENGKG